MDFPITLSGKSTAPLYRQLCDELRRMILSGRIAPGEFLPSTRDLAQMLNISRVTVVRSYEELLSQGYLEAASGSGTRVSRHLSHAALGAADESAIESAEVEPGIDHQLSNFGRWLLQSEDSDFGSTAFAEM